MFKVFYYLLFVYIVFCGYCVAAKHVNSNNFVNEIILIRLAMENNRLK